MFAVPNPVFQFLDVSVALYSNDFVFLPFSRVWLLLKPHEISMCMFCPPTFENLFLKDMH